MIIGNLFDSIDIIPKTNKNFSSNINSTIRLIFVIFLILLVLDLKYSLTFLLISTLLIFILYYNKMSYKESFNIDNRSSGPEVRVGTCSSAQIQGNNIYDDNLKLVMSRPSAYRFCNEVPLEPNAPQYISMNQRLVGEANPKTKIPPVITPPSYAGDYWAANNLSVFPAINRSTNEDVYRSGFFTSQCCGDVRNEYLVPTKKPVLYKYKNIDEDYKVMPSYESNKVDVENFTNMSPQQIRESRNAMDNKKHGFKEDYTFSGNFKNFNPDGFGEVNTACGYNPKQLFEADLPTNFPAGNCDKNPVFKNFNKNLYTQIIEPGIYTTSQVNKPINSNIGISYTQQLLPKSCSVGESGLTITEMDPRILEPYVFAPDEKPTVNESNVYDPRQNGYGTSYRAYNNKMTGQTRFYYDDIDAVRMPNYITRNNIDNNPFADQYETLKPNNANGNEFTSKIRALANDAWIRQTSGFRTDMKERLMQKRNDEMWQLREKPVTGNTQFQQGSRRIF